MARMGDHYPEMVAYVGDEPVRSIDWANFYEIVDDIIRSDRAIQEKYTFTTEVEGKGV